MRATFSRHYTIRGKKITVFTTAVTLLALVLPMLSLQAQEKIDRLVESESLYPHGRLELSLSALGNKYLGEYTDKHIGYGVAFSTRYIFPFVPELSLGARFTHGILQYDRRFKQRFGSDFARQFPPEDFPDAMTGAVRRTTKITTFEGLLYLNLFPRERLNYYLYVGYGVLSFQAQDIVDDVLDGTGFKLHYPDFRDQDEFDFHPVGGFGADFYVTRNFAIGLHAGYHHLSTDILDGYAQLRDSVTPTNNDGFADFGFRLSYYLFNDNDIDNDGLANEVENDLGTNPYSSDTDGDGVGDYEEVEVYRSSPFDADTDNDGLSDYDEAMVFSTNAFQTDTDEDGLPDFDEVKIHRTNPRGADTDLDSLTDLVEITQGSDPLVADSDGDGVLDRNDECPRIPGTPKNRGCPEKPKEAPAKVKLIRDTVVVVREITKIEKGESYTPYGINFQSGRWDISVEAEIILDDVARWLRDNPDILVEIRGHTDSQGTEGFNAELSKKRADAVRTYLVSQGLAAERLTTRGYGETRPVESNASDKGKARNRRIEFFVKDKN